MTVLEQAHASKAERLSRRSRVRIVHAQYEFTNVAADRGREITLLGTSTMPDTDVRRRRIAFLGRHDRYRYTNCALETLARHTHRSDTSAG